MDRPTKEWFMEMAKAVGREMKGTRRKNAPGVKNG